MTDQFSTEERSRIMRAIRGKDTKPEQVVRSLVHRLGFRYRLHVRELPGCPDLVFPTRRKVIFVHGCFWHRHRCRKGRSTPKTRARFWKEKLDSNKDRDAKHLRKLRRLRWSVLTIWECQTVSKKTDGLGQRICRFLDSKPPILPDAPHG
ncbi:MAG: DNA mismatch endonuclease Vsr [Planctomycetes bacterium]|nr:DNA mismatch endonuclease Vsr [Planctomycetota bacterium]